MSPPVADSTKDVETLEKKQAQRRINKPLIEKRRRARINDCLSQLKSIVLENSDSSKSPRPSKLEKADILEMTVEFIRTRVPTTPVKTEIVEIDSDIKSTTPTEPKDDFTAGYAKCLQEISRFLEKTESVNEIIKQDVVSHISQRLQNQQEQNQQRNPVIESPVKHTDKVPIFPIKKRKFDVSSKSEPEVMDLSVKVDQGKYQNQPLNLSKTSSCESSTDTESIVPLVKAPSMPVGILCGGQIMLLVQVPPSMTSHQYLTQNLPPQFSQLQNAVISNNTQPVPTMVLPQATVTNGSNESVGLPNQSTCDSTLIKSIKDRPEVESAIFAGNHQNDPDISGHWRPW